jgi:hypothetical protein
MWLAILGALVAAEWASDSNGHAGKHDGSNGRREPFRAGGSMLMPAPVWCSRRMTRPWVVLAGCLLIAGCGGSGSGPTSPSGPSGPPSVAAGTVLTVRSGETDQPIAGARIALAGQSSGGSFTAAYTADASGQFALDRAVQIAGAQLEITAPGFLDRWTFIRADEPVLTLWPASSPTGLDEDFSATIAYSGSACPAVNTGQASLRRAAGAASVVRIHFGASLEDAGAAAAHQQAIDRLNAALGGTPRYELAASAQPGIPSFVAELDPNHATCTAGPEPLRAATELQFAGGNVSGGRLVYCSVDAASSVGLVLHELGHTVGLYHSASTSDVMYCSSGRPNGFSAREQLVMKLMRLRRSGTRWPDNDRSSTSVPVSTDGVTEVIACGAVGAP